MNADVSVGWKLNYIEKALSTEQSPLSVGQTEWVAAIPQSRLSSPATGSWGVVDVGDGVDLVAALGDAIAEVRLALDLLSVEVLCSDPAMKGYLAALRGAISSYESAAQDASGHKKKVAAFSVALAMARGQLREQVSTLNAWNAIQRCVNPDAASYRVPGRFLRRLDGYLSVPAASDSELISVLDLSLLS